MQKHFSTLIAEHSLDPAQIRFVELVIDHLCKTGILSPEALYEQPFQSLDARGPDAIFPDGKILKGIFERIEEMAILTG